MMRDRGLRAAVRRFLRDSGASATAEMVIAVATLNMMMGAFFLFWKAFGAHALADRTAFTVNDLVTRQRGVELQRPLLDGLERMAEFMLDADQDVSVRFTQVTFRKERPTDPSAKIMIDWSYSPCGELPAAVAGDGFDVASLPVMAENATMIITDIEVPFWSPMPMIPSMTFERRAVSVYRFEPRFNLAGAGGSSCSD